MKRIVVLALLTALFSACINGSTTPISSSKPSEVAEVLSSYKSWTRLTTEPRPVAIGVWLLCRLVSEEEYALAESEHGERYLNLYVNPVGASTIGIEGERSFPVGTVIVKEKLLHVDDLIPDSIGLMIKREMGFNRMTNDWHYLYQQSDGVLVGENEELTTCQVCHISNVEGDSVYYRGN